MSSGTLVARPAKVKTNSPTIIDSKDTLPARFAKWIYKETMDINRMPNGRIISRERCAIEISRLRDNDGKVTYGAVTSVISDAREYCENNLNCTIWTIPGRGWRASTKIETAKYCGKTIRKTLAWAERARRVFVITDKKLLHHTIREVVTSAGHKVVSLSEARKKFLTLWGNYEKSEQKQLEAPKK